MNVEQKLQMIQAMRENQTNNVNRLHYPENMEQEYVFEDGNFFRTLGFRVFLSLLLLGICVFLKYSNQRIGGIGFENIYEEIRQNWNMTSILQTISTRFFSFFQ